MDIHFRQVHNEDDAQYIERMTMHQRQNAAAKTFCTAIVDARKAATFQGLRPYQLQDGGWGYNAAQGASAACHATEDASATLQMQFAVLKRLDGIATLLKIGLAALAYIAYRVS
jgi:hypothetical protein